MVTFSKISKMSSAISSITTLYNYDTSNMLSLGDILVSEDKKETLEKK